MRTKSHGRYFMELSSFWIVCIKKEGGKCMRNIIVSVITLIIMIGVNFGLASIFNWNFIDFSLFVGLACTLIIRYFTSTGGLSSNMVRVQTQAITGIKVEEEKHTFKPTYAYYTALVYTVISLIGIFIYYKDYFI
jgi:hypothetical protein